MTPAQKSALYRAKHLASGGAYMPANSETRTFEALERRGLVFWQSVDLVRMLNAGYAITDKGDAALSKAQIE